MHDAYLAALLDELSARGIPADALGHPLPEAASAEQFAELMVRAARLSGDPGFGIAFGLRLNLASHGMLGYALMSSRNGDQLMQSLTRFARLAIPGVTLARVLEGTRFRLTFQIDAPLAYRMLLTEVIIASLSAAARALFSRRIPGAEVWLDYPAPAHGEAYRALGVPVRFDQAACAMVCSREFLDMPLPSANPVLAEIGDRQCHALLREMRHRDGLASQARLLLLRSAGAFPTQDDVARRLHLSPRTLRRRLADEGTSYRDILDEVRFELARRYLDTGEIPVTEVALLLGYDDPANFRRAFKRWSGTTAQSYKRSTRD